MKLTIFLLFLTVCLNGQDLPQGCVPVLDSSYLNKLPNPNKILFGKKDSIFFVQRDYICEDGRRAVPGPAVPVGDSSVVMGNLKANAINLSRQWAAAVVISTMKQEVVTAPIRAINRTTTTLFNKSIFPELQAQFPDSMFVGDYKFTPEGGATIDATVTKNAGGQLRLRWGANNKQLRVLSDLHVRILDYTTGKDLDLVRRDTNTPRWDADNGALKIVNKKIEARIKTAQK